MSNWIELEMVRGDTGEFDVTVYDPVTGNPLSLTGAAMKMMAKYSFDDLDSEAVIDIDEQDGITFTDPTNGLAHLVVPSIATETLPAGGNTRLYFDVQVEKAGKKWTVARGVITVRPGVVRS